ncbi:tail fiber assembly protein, partial [Salmonella enterica subsp. diarizonae]|nr:tail fiber assembly protein [Salmonella enterica subsp. diarizonae]MJB99340.1 tail fiber assembly protein [Salmonella enterica subsp. diarizonae]
MTLQYFKNFTLYAPVPDENNKIPLRKGAKFFKSEDGHDWYECQKLFSPDTIKIAHNSAGVIVSIGRDVSGFWPEGKSIAEVHDTTANRRADISGGWQFKDGKVVQRVYSP